MVQHRVLICLTPMLTLLWPSMTHLPIISILSRVFGRDLEMIVFVLWEHGTASPFFFLDYLNTMDKAGKIKFIMEIPGDRGLKFFDLQLKIKEGKMRVDVYAKSTSSFG